MAIGIGLEVGPSCIRGVVVEGAGAGQPRLAAAHEVVCDTARPESLTRALTELRQTLGIKTPVVLGLPTSSAILTTITPLIANPRRPLLALQFELQQQLPFELGDAVWHYAWLSGNGHPMRKFGVRSAEFGVRSGGSSTPHSAFRIPHSDGAVVAAMRRSLLDERLACCRRAGLFIHSVAVNPIATFNAWYKSSAHRGEPSALSDAPDATSVALVNVISEQMGEWILWSPPGRPGAPNLSPQGGRHPAPPEKSGAPAAGWTPASLQVLPILSPSPEALLQELAASWESIRAHSTEPSPRVWVVSASGVWPRLQAALGTQGLQVERLEVSHLFGDGTAARPEPSSGSWITATGLALQALGLAHVPLNLVASAQRQRRAVQVQRIATITTWLCVATTLVLGLSGMLELRSRRARVLDTLMRQERLYQTLRPDVRALLQHQQQIQQHLEQLERLVHEASVLGRFLAQVATVMPNEVWLTKVECSKRTPPGEAEASAADIVEGLLEGRAASFQALTQFMDRLKGVSSTMTVKPISTSVTKDEGSGKEVVVFAVQVQHLPAPHKPPPEDAGSASEEKSPPR